MTAPLINGQALAGKKALIVGVANESSIAYGCAKAFKELGANIAITYQNDKARSFVEPVAQELGADIFAPLDVTQPDQISALFETIAQRWGKLDLLVHSIAFAPKADLQNGLLNSSPEGFAKAMDISCHSFLRLAREAVPL
ncbi:MAG: SDR family oxidoreductase, partial [Aquabacterium sp.]|uniref:SDR family oxidoreductase n=1 Tax=Aquabacterium sp. TaxID=1872578 RepID=UPI001228ECAF